MAKSTKTNMDFFIHAALLGLILMFCLFCGSILLNLAWIVLVITATAIFAASKSIVELIKRHI